MFYLPRDETFMDVPEIIVNPFVNSIDETEEEIMTNFLSTSFIMLISKNPNINTRWTTALDFRKLEIFVQNHTIKLTPPEQVFNILGKAMYASIFQITQGPNDYTQFYKNFSVHQDTSNDKNRQIIMAGLFSPLCLIFFRRIICINKDFNSHQNSVEKNLELLSRNKLKIQPTTSEFFQRNILYLGHQVIRNVVIANPSLIKEITKRDSPKTFTEVKMFYYQCKYISKFISKFNNISYPLLELLQKRLDTFKWNEFADNSFHRLKDSINKLEPLKLYNSEEHIILLVNRNKNFINCTLAQGTIEKFYVILNQDKILNQNETKLDVLEQDLLSIVWSLQFYHPFLIKKTFTLISCNISLPWLLKLNHMPLNLIHYRTEIEKYKFNLESGKEQEMFQTYKIQVKETGTLTGAYNEIKDGRILSKNYKRIPKISERPEIMRKFHLNYDNSHRNITKTKNQISREFKWPGMFKDIEVFVDDCPVCSHRPQIEEKIVDHTETKNKLKVTTIVVPIYPARECLM